MILILVFILFSFTSFSQSWGNISKLIQDQNNKLFTHSEVLVAKSNEVVFDFKIGDRHIFDLASLTKVVATTTAVMILYDQGKLKLSDEIYKFIPSFDVSDKKMITIEDLLRHQGGFKSGQVLKTNESLQNFIQRIAFEPLQYAPRTKMVYSDLGFIILGLIVEQVTQSSLENFCQNEIFKPLNMNETYFNPLKMTKKDCVPTLKDNECLAHDPTAAFFYPHDLGHAGLFSSTNDLYKFVAMIADKGLFGGKRILSEESVKIMTTLPPGQQRGLGWDISSPGSVNPRGDYFPKNISFGHTGYTGTTLWIDPISKTFYIFLSNRTLLGDEETRIPFIGFRKKLSNEMGKILYPGLTDFVEYSLNF